MSRQPLTTLTEQVPTEVYLLGKAVQTLLVQVKAVQGKGLTVGQEIPAVLLGSLTDLLGALQGYSEVPGIFTEDPVLAVKALLIPVMSGLDVLLKK